MTAVKGKRLTREMMRHYLENKIQYDMRLIIRHPKTVQKSYRNEKRFFCPPPCIFLQGYGWRRRQEYMLQLTKSDLRSRLYAFVGESNSRQQTQLLDFRKKDFCAAKTLFISDPNKRKQFRLAVKMFSANGMEIGDFISNEMNIISKPSRQINLFRNPSLCIASGTKVALFNRIRNQTISTRYLSAQRRAADDGGTFCTVSEKWGAFTIYLLDDDEPESERFTVKDGYIHYGSTVKLVCDVTRLALPRLVIRKVDKQLVSLEANDPVLQLHKCALFFKDTGRRYLGIEDDKILQLSAKACPREPNKEIVGDSALWTIISTDSAEYTFAEVMGPVSSPLAPVPIVHSLKLCCSGPGAKLEVAGANFRPYHKVWLGPVECDTKFMCESSLVCKVPDISALRTDWRRLQDPQHVDVMIVRQHDGVIYSTGCTFTYTPARHHRPCRKSVICGPKM